MSYIDQLHPWRIIPLLPKMQRIVVARCRSRSDAKGHVQLLRRLMPNATFTVIFDPTPEQPQQ